MKPKIVIWGADNYNALGLLRQLAVKFDSLYFANTGRKFNCASASKYCYNYMKIPANEVGVDKLIRQFDNTSQKAVLIPSGDEVAEIIDKHSEKLRNYFHISGTQIQGKLTEIDNKNVMTEMALRHRFTVPNSMTFRVGDRMFDPVSFPAVLKPVECDDGIHEFKYLKFDSAERLIEFEKYLNPNNTYILQDYIPKSNDILVYGVRLNDGQTIFAGKFVKDRWSDDGGGSHGFITEDVPDCLNPVGVRTFLQEINYKGLFSVEYGLYNGTAYFYEFNLRNDGTSHLFFQSGANLPLKWCCDCLRICEEIPTTVKGKHENINEIYDITNVFKGKVSLRQYLKERKRADVFHFKYYADNRPYRISLLKSIYDVPFRSILKFSRPYLTYIIRKIR